MVNTTFNVGHTQVVTATPQDANNNDGAIVASVIPAWTVAPAGIVTILAAANGLSATLTSVTPGVATINLQGESSSGTIINTQFTATIQQAPATQFTFSFGPVV